MRPRCARDVMGRSIRACEWLGSIHRLSRPISDTQRTIFANQVRTVRYFSGCRRTHAVWGSRASGSSFPQSRHFPSVPEQSGERQRWPRPVFSKRESRQVRWAFVVTPARISISRKLQFIHIFIGLATIEKLPVGLDQKTAFWASPLFLEANAHAGGFQKDCVHVPHVKSLQP